MSWITDLFTPTEAEARVTARDKSSQDALDTMADRSSKGIDEFKKLLYSIILDKAQKEGQNVDISQRKVLGGIGEYTPSKQELALSQSYYKDVPSGNPALQNTLAHELLHFLLGEYGKAEETYNTRGLSSISNDTPIQHDIIRYLLGNDKAPEFSPYEYQKQRPLQSSNIPQSTREWSPFNAALAEIMKRLFSGTPLQQGVIQRNE